MNRRRFLKSSALYSGLVGALGWTSTNSATLCARGAGKLTNSGKIDLKDAVVVAPHTLSKRERKSVQVLIEEVQKRTGLRWPIVEQLSRGTRPSILAGSISTLKHVSAEFPSAFLSEGKQPSSSEGYRLRTIGSPGAPMVQVAGAGERGVLFGVGGLLRSLQMSKGQVGLSGPLDIASSPRYGLRGHQLGYRPTPNSYDGWTVQMWDDYIRDLAVFGTNAIELIPPEPDHPSESPHFWLPRKQMMVEMCRIADEYGLDVWIWSPALAGDYSDPRAVEASVTQWGEIFRMLPRIDALFVPGGDPGYTPPKYLLSLLEKQSNNLRQYHPDATTWVSTQHFSGEWLNEFCSRLSGVHPKWLKGIVYGPHNRIDLPSLRKRIPPQYPIRLYPDIAHTVECQFPVPDWDSAYAFTEGREPINPRPAGYANIARLQLPHSIGFVAYSEGCNDDVNKIVWSSLAWDPERPVIDILREYSRYFIGDRYEEDFAQGLLSLERNWQGPLLTNEGVDTTLRQFQAMEGNAEPHDLLKWRFQQGLYRAYYDAYVRSRLLYESDLESQAMNKLEEIRRPGTAPVLVHMGDKRPRPPGELTVSTILQEARGILERAQTKPIAQDWRTRILTLGATLYQSIRMQLSVERYKAAAVSRGGNLDTLDAPLTNCPWLLERITAISKLGTLEEQVAAIDEILNWANPGPGGFYDDLGDLTRQSHLVRGPGGSKDPEFFHSSLVGYSGSLWIGVTAPVSWKRWAGSMYDSPLKMKYTLLDPHAQYKLRVVYSGDEYGNKIELRCNRGQMIHPLLKKPWPPKPLEFDVPRQATQSGSLMLEWTREQGKGGNGRGCQVAEVWLIKKKEF